MYMVDIMFLSQQLSSVGELKCDKNCNISRNKVTL